MSKSPLALLAASAVVDRPTWAALDCRRAGADYPDIPPWSLMWAPPNAVSPFHTRVPIPHHSMTIPGGTHILLDVWHANRHEDHWGVERTGFPAAEFVPDRWEKMAEQNLGSKEMLHFGFGHGSRVCPGKHLGELEVGLVVGVFVRLFRFRAVNAENPARASVSTRPLDGTLVDLSLR